jgi:hypothetical protein
MSITSDNSKTYLRQMESSELEREFWKRLKADKHEGFIWKKDQTEPYSMSAILDKSAKDSIALEIDKTYAGIIKENYSGLTVFVKFKFSDTTQVFTSGRLSFDEANKCFKVQLISPFFITTKRSACRYTTTDVDRIKVSFAGFTFDCYDISSGGFSALVKRDSFGGLEKGQSFEKADLKYNVKRFEIPKITLVNIIENKDQPDWVRLAFKFEGLKPTVEDTIWVEVNTSVKRLADLLG